MLLSGRSRFVALACLVAVLLAACGQKPGVHVNSALTSGSGKALDSSAGAVDELGNPVEAGAPGSAGSGGSTTTTTGGGAAGGTTGATGTTGGPAAKGNSTGVSDSEIIVGIHAPVTGAAPFPTNSFAQGRDIFWTWSGAPSIFGRKVKILFEDDQYNPTTARDRCRKMAEQQKAFLLVGGGGTDQIQACAQYAAQNGIPYLSAGVTEIGLNNLPNYFAVSESYKQQTEQLAQFIASDSRLSSLQDKVAMVRTDTPNFDDAHQGFLNAMQKRNKTLVLDKTLPKNPSQNDYNQMAVDLAGKDAQVVFILTAPIHYVQLTARLAPNYRPWWVGVGISMGLNVVLETGCQTSNNAIDKGLFLTPFPGVDKIDSLDPDYNKAYQDKNGRKGDDLGIALWGLNKTLAQMFQKVGKDLTRQGFISTVAQSSFTTSVYPPLAYTPKNRFGASQTHQIKADCASKTYKTERTFVSSF